MTIKKIQKLNKQLVDILASNKAENLISLDIRNITELADYMIIASGTSKRHLNALADTATVHAKKSGFRPLSVSGNSESDWVLVDLGDVIIHLMLPETRELYALEELWDRAFMEAKMKPKTKVKTKKTVSKKVVKPMPKKRVVIKKAAKPAAKKRPVAKSVAPKKLSKVSKSKKSK